MCRKKIAYKIISNDDLNKITDSTHHEGVCFIIRKKEVLNFKKYLSKFASQKKTSCVVVLENVQNPHNIGAILRVCANFAVDGILLSNSQYAQSSAAYRTAEGGAEWVHILETGELAKAVEEFKKHGFTVTGTSSHAGKSLTKIKFSEKNLILFGSETEGLTQTLVRTCDNMTYIPQSGHVESLNVACAASIILYECNKNNLHS